MSTRILIIGGGPGGYVAAIRAAQLGGEVTLIEREHLGGTCLNCGCIPTKSLIHAAEYAKSAAEAAEYGVELSLAAIHWDKVIEKKRSITRTLVKGVEQLLKAHKVRVIRGEARLTGKMEVTVTEEDGNRRVLSADKVILATGSRAAMPPIPGLRESGRVLDPTAGLELSALPEEMLILGGGVIGVEMAAAYCGFGCKVTILEALDRLVPGVDAEIAKTLLKSLKEQGIAVKTGCPVIRVGDEGEKVSVTVEEDGKETVYTADYLLCAAGRKPCTEGLGLESAGIYPEKGFIPVNEYLETSASGIYAIGDCIGKGMLAHTASAAGEIAAENALGGCKVYDPACVPSCLYTFPECASVGLTEEQAKEQGIPYHVGRFGMAANGRALIANGGKGLAKVIVGDELEEILGVHLIGPNVTEIIGEAALAIDLEATAEELAETIHAHPTVSEALREAVLDSRGEAIHRISRKR